MKDIKTLAVVTALGLAACSSAFAQGRPGGDRGQRPSDAPQPSEDAAAAVTHIAEAYPKVAPFDANHDGQLDGGERRALGQAMLDGTIEAPNHRTPPEGVEPPHPGIIIKRIASLYRVAFSFDADKNGSLSEGEQAGGAVRVIRPPWGSMFTRYNPQGLRCTYDVLARMEIPTDWLWRDLAARESLLCSPRRWRDMTARPPASATSTGALLGGLFSENTVAGSERGSSLT